MSGSHANLHPETRRGVPSIDLPMIPGLSSSEDLYPPSQGHLNQTKGCGMLQDNSNPHHSIHSRETPLKWPHRQTLSRRSLWNYGLVHGHALKNENRWYLQGLAR